MKVLCAEPASVASKDLGSCWEGERLWLLRSPVAEPQFSAAMPLPRASASSSFNNRAPDCKCGDPRLEANRQVQTFQEIGSDWGPGMEQPWSLAH